MDFIQVLDLPSRQARILRTIWFPLMPVVIILDCFVLGVLAVKFRHSNAQFVSFLEGASRIHTLALWFGLLPLVAWTAVFWWQQRLTS